MAKSTFLKLPDQKRERVLEAALDEFANQPYSQASISKVVKNAGISKGSVYQYFEDKFGLFKWLFQRALEVKMSYVSMEPPVAGAFLPWLQDQWRAGFAFAKAHPRLARVGLVFWDKDPEVGSLAHRVWQMRYEMFETWVREAQDFGEIRNDIDTDILTSMLLSAEQNMLDALCVRAGVPRVEALFSARGIARIDDAEIEGVIESVFSIYIGGVDTGSPPSVHPTCEHSPIDTAALVAEIFGPTKA